MKLRVYIAGPISKGDLLANIRQADDAFARLLKAGFAPLCPHWSVFHGSAQRQYVTPFPLPGEPEPDMPPLTPCGEVIAFAHPLPGGSTHADWMGADLPWVAASDAVLRLPGESAGADMETAEADRRGVPVFHDIASLVIWAQMGEMCNG